MARSSSVKSRNARRHSRPTTTRWRMDMAPFSWTRKGPTSSRRASGTCRRGKEVLVRLTYVTELSVDAWTRLRFTIPTTVSPRYAPAQDQRRRRPFRCADVSTRPSQWRVPYGLDLAVSESRCLAESRGSNHRLIPCSVTINRRRSDREARAGARRRSTATSCCPSTRPERTRPRPSSSALKTATEAIAVSFVPAFSETASPAEIIFVVDRSGSMQGTSIDEVRNALQLCLRSMISGCRFNIVGFGSTHEPLFPETRAYDTVQSRRCEQARGRAAGQSRVAPRSSPALDFALGQPPHAELPRQVVVLTDGQVSNTDAVLALATKHASEARIFTFGIGAGASQHLVRGLARAGGGAAEFIYPGERIEPKVVRQFGRLLSPALTNVCMEWDGADVVQAPSALPPVFSGGRLLLYGFLRQETPSAAPTRARLSAETPSGPVTFDVSIDGANVRTGRTVATLAARARIRELRKARNGRARAAHARSSESQTRPRKRSSASACVTT